MPSTNDSSLLAAVTTLYEALRAVHPANIRGGLKPVVDFMAEQMKEPPTPVSIFNYRKLEEKGREMLAYTPPEAFDLDLTNYARILAAVHDWLFCAADGGILTNLDTFAWDVTFEIERIGRGLGFTVWEHELRAALGAVAVSFDPVDAYLTDLVLDGGIRGVIAHTMGVASRKASTLKAELKTLEAGSEEAKLVSVHELNFDRCVQFDACIRDLRNRAENAIRGIGARVAALTQLCAPKLEPRQREAAGAFSQQLSAAAETIKAK